MNYPILDTFKPLTYKNLDKSTNPYTTSKPILNIFQNLQKAHTHTPIHKTPTTTII